VHTIAGCALARDRLRGWACRTRTQKCRDKISLERSDRFAGIQPNSGFGDCSRLSCAAGEMPRREVGIGGTVRHGSFRDGTPTRLDRETCRWLHARGDRARAPGGTSPLCRNSQRTAIWDMGEIAASGDPGALDLFWLPQVRNGRHAEGPFENMWRAMATDCKISSPLSPNCGVPLELPVAVRSKPIAQLARYIARVSPARG
jgi:hypothetical protein